MARTPIEVAGNLNPVTAFEAKLSIPYCIASALLIGSVRFDAFTNTALSDPTIRELIHRTDLKVADEFESVFPRQRAARVVINRKNGETVSEEAWTRHGDPVSAEMTGSAT
jgi:2-methylcitrate dehydratase PrpD